MPTPSASLRGQADIGYTGQRLDSYIKLVQMGARWYSPELGRWLSPDTIVPDPANPQSLNRFSYVNNRPLNYIDPSGHVHCVPGFGGQCDDMMGGVGAGEAAAGIYGVLLFPLTFASEAFDIAATGLQCVNTGCTLADVAVTAIPGAIGPLAKGAGKIYNAVDTASDIAKKIPFGFRHADEFAQFGVQLNDGLKKVGFDDVQAFMQGSAVTGVKYTTSEAFDVGRVSDFDIALASPTMLDKAKGLGMELRSGGARTGPLSAIDLQRLGLSDLANELSMKAGRPVNFMIFDSAETVISRAPSIPIP